MKPASWTDAQRAPRRLALALLLYLALLTVVVALLDRAQFNAIFSEGGPVESLTTPLWLMLAAWCLDPLHPRRRGVTVCGLLALLLAMREADWQHNEQANMSVLKLKFYAQAAVPLVDRIIAGALTLAALALLIYALVLGLRHLRQAGRALLQPAWAAVFALGLFVLGLSKGLDRLINGIVELSGNRIGGVAGRLIGGWEEGLELALPLIFSLSLLLYRRLSAATAAAAAAGAPTTGVRAPAERLH